MVVIKMFKFFSFLQSITMIVLFIEFFLSITGEKVHFIQSEYLFLVYVFGLFVSCCSLFFITGKKEKKEEFVTINGIRFQKYVLIQLVDNILKEKKQLKGYKINFNTNHDDEFVFEIEAIPIIEEEYSFHTFAEEVTKEVKEKIEKYTTYEKTNTIFTFKVEKEEKKE